MAIKKFSIFLEIYNHMTDKFGQDQNFTHIYLFYVIIRASIFGRKNKFLHINREKFFMLYHAIDSVHTLRS